MMKEFLENLIIIFWTVILITPVIVMFATGLYIELFKDK